MSTWRYTCTRDQGNSLTFIQGHSDFINFKQLALKPLDSLMSNYILSLYETRGPKFVKTNKVTGLPCP